MDTFITIILYILCFVIIAAVCLIFGGLAWYIGNEAKECADKGNKSMTRIIVFGSVIIATILIMLYGGNEYRKTTEEYESTGYEEGYEEGHHEGYELGYEEAHDSGYEEGYNDGENTACEEEYQYGYSIGYYDGSNKLEYNDEY